MVSEIKKIPVLLELRLFSAGASQVVPVIKNQPTQAGDFKRCRSHPWVRKIPWRRVWQPTPVFLPGEFCGQKTLAS